MPEHQGELGSISAYVKGRNKQISYPLPILMSSVKVVYVKYIEVLVA